MIFYKESKSNIKNLAFGWGRGGGVARVSDFFLFSKKSKSGKKIVFLFRG